MPEHQISRRDWFRLGRAFLWGQYIGLLPNQRCYLNAAIFFCFYPVFTSLGWELADGLLSLAWLFGGIAVAIDLTNAYGRFAESTFGKIVTVAVVGIGGNFAIAAAAQMVNEITGVDPGKFVHTIAFSSIFTAAILVAFLMSIVFFVGLGLGIIYLTVQWTEDDVFRSIFLPWAKAPERIPFRRITLTVQVISIISLCWYAYSWLKDGQPGYTAFVEDKARWFLYTFEMYEKAQCSLEKGQRVAFLDGGLVLVATEAGESISFQIQECPVSVGSR